MVLEVAMSKNIDELIIADLGDVLHLIRETWMIGKNHRAVLDGVDELTRNFWSDRKAAKAAANM